MKALACRHSTQEASGILPRLTHKPTNKTRQANTKNTNTHTSFFAHSVYQIFRVRERRVTEGIGSSYVAMK